VDVFDVLLILQIDLYIVALRGSHSCWPRSLMRMRKSASLFEFERLGLEGSEG
jgi:hypothetical protein